MPRYRTPAELARIPKKPPAPSLRTRAEARGGSRANGTDEPGSSINQRFGSQMAIAMNSRASIMATAISSRLASIFQVSTGVKTHPLVQSTIPHPSGKHAFAAFPAVQGLPLWPSAGISTG
jgi:hypothetical protein